MHRGSGASAGLGRASTRAASGPAERPPAGRCWPPRGSTRWFLRPARGSFPSGSVQFDPPAVPEARRARGTSSGVPSRKAAAESAAAAAGPREDRHAGGVAADRAVHERHRRAEQRRDESPAQGAAVRGERRLRRHRRRACPLRRAPRRRRAGGPARAELGAASRSPSSRFTRRAVRPGARGWRPCSGARRGTSAPQAERSGGPRCGEMLRAAMKRSMRSPASAAPTASESLFRIRP